MEVQVTADGIEQAAAALREVAPKTPLFRSRSLDRLAGGRLHLKMESLQRSGAFKFRGAYTALLRNLDRARARGVVTASSGNHAGALALAAKILGVRAVVVMPTDAVSVKLSAVRDFGAEVHFCGRSSAERLGRAQELVEAEGLLFLPPYDHPDVLAGQGTVAQEVLEEVPDLDVFVAPCGGGGLLAGCAAYLRERAPHVAVYGVEPEAGDDTRRSLAAGERVEIAVPDTLCDGARNVTPGALTFPINRACVEEILTVSDERVLETMRLLFLRAKAVCEPTGALAPAALLQGGFDLGGRTAVAVISGGNVEPSLLGRVFAG